MKHSGGIWMPQQIVANKDMTYVEKMIVSIVVSLESTDRGCYASNDYLAFRVATSTKNISKSLQSLRKKGIVDLYTVGGSRNRERYIKIIDGSLDIEYQESYVTEKVVGNIYKNGEFLCSSDDDFSSEKSGENQGEKSGENQGEKSGENQGEKSGEKSGENSEIQDETNCTFCEETDEKLYPLKAERIPLKAEHYPLKAEHYPLKAEHYPLKAEHYPLKVDRLKRRRVKKSKEEEKEKIKNKNTLSIHSLDEPKEIIDFLNSVTESSFRSSSTISRKHINARLNEGYNLDDFKRVILVKNQQWKNTDMAQYLRPSTLFGNKFEGYLNTPVPKDVKIDMVRNQTGMSAKDIIEMELGEQLET